MYNGVSLFLTLRNRVFQEVPELIEMKREGPYWDFKKEWHKDNPELIHDILCLANNVEREVSYLVIGIDEERDYSVCDVRTNTDTTRRTNQGIIDMLSKTPWGSAQAPFALIEPLELEDGVVDILAVVSRREDMPYFLAKGSGSVRPWMVHTRRVDQNTPIDEGANWSEIQQIWRHHFSLDESPIARMQLMLEDKQHWFYISETENKYYAFAPEFTITHEPDDSRDGYEYYMLNQTDSRPHWYTIDLNCFQTVIYSSLGIALDGGRYFAPVPSRSFLRWYGVPRDLNADIVYCYYVKGSIDWSLNEFFFDESHNEAVWSRDRLLKMVLLFENEDEREGFEHVLQFDKNEFDRRLAKVDDPCGPGRLPEDYAQRGKDALGAQMKSAIVLQGMLVDYRAGTLVNEGLRTSRDW